MVALMSAVQLSCLQRKVKMYCLDLTLFRLTPFGSIEAHRRFGETYHPNLEVIKNVKQATNKRRADCSLQIISSSLRTKTVLSSETSVELYRTAGSHIPEDKYIL
jgi:hypothetical protein